LEQFNGQTILDKWVRPGAFVVAYSPEQGVLIQQAYDALKTSVYGGLVVQTRLKRTSGWNRETRKCYRLNSCLRNGYEGYSQKTPKNSALQHAYIPNHYSGTQQ